MKHSEVIKECRAEARKNGLTFKETSYSSERLYSYVNRKTQIPVRTNLTLGLAYTIACSGELENYNN